VFETVGKGRRPGERARIGQHCLIFEHAIHDAQALNHMKLVGNRNAFGGDVLVVETNGVDNKRIAVPVTNRVAEPGLRDRCLNINPR